ncbi:zinc finger, CCHC-type containing protein [Tanacetum coccineum]
MFMGLSVPQYFNGYVVTTGEGHFDELMLVIFTSPATAAGIVSMFLDRTLGYGDKDIVGDFSNVESAKELWDSLESKYMVEDASSKKFLTGHFKRDCRNGNKKNANAGGSGKGSKDQSQDQDQNLVDAIAWWIDSRATTHVCKDRCWFKTYEPVEDGFVLYMGDDHSAPVHGKGSVALEFSFGKTITLFNVLYVPKLRKNLVSGPMLNKCGYKQVHESDKYILSESGVFVGFGYYNNGMFMLNLNKVRDGSDSVYMSSSTVVNSSLWHARLGHVHYKRMLEMSKDDLIPAIDENPEKSPYTLQQNGVAERKNKALKEMVNSMLFYSGLSEGFWGEAMMTACYLLNRVPNKRNKTTPYELWYKKRPNLSFLPVWGCRAVVRLPDPKRKILGEKESRDAIFDENCFSLVPRPKDIIPNSVESQKDDHYDLRDREIKLDHNTLTAIVLRKILELIMKLCNLVMLLSRKKQLMMRLVLLWKIIHRFKPLGCKWIFKRKMKVDGTIDKFKARLVIQGFRQKEGIDYFDTYAPVARITTIRLLLALAAIHNLVIHQMDVKTAFSNGDFDEEVYMKQPEGFVMPDCSLVSTLMDPVEKPRPNTGKPVDQLEYSRAIGCLMYAMTSTRPDMPISSSTSGWVFLLGGGAISWASKKQTCITGSTIESEFVALAAVGKEVEWLRNLIHEIPIWPKPIAPISIHCDSVATLAKAYNQMYNGKSRHLGVRHSMIRELIMNGVISIEFVRSQQNLAD